MNCRAALIICENLGRWRAKATYTVHAGQIFEIKNIDLHSLKAWRTLTIQTSQNTVLQALINSTNIWTATWLYNIILSENLAYWILDHRDLILASRNSKCSSFETWGLSLESRLSSVNLLLNGTVGQIIHWLKLYKLAWQLPHKLSVWTVLDFMKLDITKTNIK